MKALTSFEQLTAKLNEAEEKQAISDDAFREAVSSWYLSPAIFGEIPNDPFSPEFKAFQLKIYERLTDKVYDVANEETVFNFDHEILWPYPYGTKSAQTVGTHLMGYGWLIKAMNLPAESRILEIGSGYGSLTVHLASMGYRVTCLDISSSLLTFTKARTDHLPQQIKTICGDMATVEIGESFDAIILNASLHHSLEHRAVIERLEPLLAANGIVAFTAEPVVGDDSVYVPYPWGIRLGGLSIWSICKWGWLELGFQESYFIRILHDAGWKLTRYNLGISGHTDVWIAARARVKDSSSAVKSTSQAYDIDPEIEIIRLRKLVEGYEQGRFIRTMNWLKGRR
jgi:protein-L-isoaspartate O-methyltransferase